MWQKFTERARKAVFIAQEKAASVGSKSVGTEHLLLGLLRIEDCLACSLLRQMAVDPDALRQEVEARVSKGGEYPGEDMLLTPRAKRTIDLAYEEAVQLDNDYIGTEHLLLGLIREEEGLAGRILANYSVSPASARQLIVQVQTAGAGRPQDAHTMTNQLRGKDLISIRDLGADDIWAIFHLCAALKAEPLEDRLANPRLPGKILAMVFEKPSLRTRVTFEVGMKELGGHAVFLHPSEAQIGEREPASDVARNLERWVHGIAARTFAHGTVVEFAGSARIPVINALSDVEHPCQALADFFTIYEKRGDLSGVKLAYVGDGNNVCHSLMLAAAKLGVTMTVACPEGYEPNTVLWEAARREAKQTGASISVTGDPFEAVQGADVIYTDVWASMGQEEERETRLRAFEGYQVNQPLVDAAGGDVMVMHCLPAHRGEEIAADVIDSPRSIVFDQAENRLHVQKAVLALLL